MQPDHLDDILAQIGFGKFHITLYVAIGLAILADGAEMLNVSLVTQALAKEWMLTPAQKGFLGSSVFIGFALGSLLAGYAGDRYGRRFPLLGSVSLMFVFGLASAFAVHYESLVVLRIMVGTGIGSTVVLVNTMFTEMLPADHRGRWLVLNSLFFPLGEIVGAALAWCARARDGPELSRCVARA